MIQWFIFAMGQLATIYPDLQNQAETKIADPVVRQKVQMILEGSLNSLPKPANAPSGFVAVSGYAQPDGFGACSLIVSAGQVDPTSQTTWRVTGNGMASTLRPALLVQVDQQVADAVLASGLKTALESMFDLYGERQRAVTYSGSIDVNGAGVQNLTII